jgi:hypothetical protein
MQPGREHNPGQKGSPARLIESSPSSHLFLISAYNTPGRRKMISITGDDDPIRFILSGLMQISIAPNNLCIIIYA